MLARSVFGLARIGQRFPVAIPSLVRPLSSVVAAPTTTSASGSEAATPRKKHKVPQKRASSLLHQLKNEHFDKLVNGRKYVDFKAGDAIELDIMPFLTAEKPDVIKGLVIARANRGVDTSVTIINNEMGTPVRRQIKIYSPLVKDIRVLQKAFIYEGRKRVRRNKIYYMQEQDPKFFTIN